MSLLILIFSETRFSLYNYYIFSVYIFNTHPKDYRLCNFEIFIFKFFIPFSYLLCYLLHFVILFYSIALYFITLVCYFSLSERNKIFPRVDALTVTRSLKVARQWRRFSRLPFGNNNLFLIKAFLSC